MENPLQNQLQQNDVMTLGDFFADTTSVNIPKDVMTLDEFEGNPAPPSSVFAPVPEEHKVGFIKGATMNLYSGMLSGATSFNQLIGLGAFKETTKIFVTPGTKEAARLREKSYSENKGIQFGNDFVSSLGNLGVTLPIDVMTGGQTKIALTGKILPKMETILSRIPDFALGSGWRGLLAGVEEPGTIPEKTIGGIIGAGEYIAIMTAYGHAGKGLKAIPIMTSLGWGNSVYEAAKEGRVPTREEQMNGAATGTAYGVIFALLPVLKRSTKIGVEKEALGKYEKLIKDHANNGDFNKVKETVDTLMTDKNIRPEIKEAINTALKAEKPTPKGEEIPPVEPPVGKITEVLGEGEIRVRGLAKGVEEKAIENKLTRSLGDLPEYRTVSMKDQASKSQDLLTKDIERAKRIAMGEELAPEGILPESIFVAIENRAIKEGDVSTLRALATSSSLTAEATTMGQRIRTLAERDPESPVAAINEIAKAREESAQKRLKTKETVRLKKETVDEIKKEIKKASPTKETWADFIKSLQC